MPNISVVIACYNEEKYIQNCLERLLPQLSKGDEIIVVDNNSTDRSKEIIKTFPVRLLEEAKQGTSHARNTGSDGASNPIIARTDADSLVSKDWLKQIREYYSDKNHTGAITGPTILTNPRVPRMRLDKGLTMKALGHLNVVGCNYAMPKALWNIVKPYATNDDAEYAEDTELSGLIVQVAHEPIEFLPGMEVRTSGRWLIKRPVRSYKSWKRRQQNTLKYLEQFK